MLEEGNNVYEIQDLEKRSPVIGSSLENEKKVAASETFTATSEDDQQYIVESSEATKLSWFHKFFASLNAETKGVEPVTEDEKRTIPY